MLLRQIDVFSYSYIIFKKQRPIGTCLALTILRVAVTQYLLIDSQNFNKGQKEEKMKKLMVQLFIIGVVIATYALPVLASGGAGP